MTGGSGRRESVESVESVGGGTVEQKPTLSVPRRSKLIPSIRPSRRKSDEDGEAAGDVVRSMASSASDASRASTSMGATLTMTKRLSTPRALFESLRKRVGFTRRASIHDARQQMEDYGGVHPRFFEFNRQGKMQLTDEGLAENMRREEAGEKPLRLNRSG